MAIFLVLTPTSPARAEPDINIVVKTVLASEDSKFSDPRISDLIREISSVFRYSSYRLLSQNTLKPGISQTGTASLPEKGILKITPLRIKDNRVQLDLSIFRKKRRLFQTELELLNHSSLTVGGPKYKGGFLLFNISASF